MCDNNYNVQNFELFVKNIIKQEIFIDLDSELTEDEKGDYVQFISSDDFTNLYEASIKKNTIERKMKHQLKKVIRYLKSF